MTTSGNERRSPRRPPYEVAVAETWRHQPLDAAPEDLRALVRYATLAASSHNTQPWLFDLAPLCVGIRADRSRRCPEVDPDDHHLFTSLGCAAENLLLAAEAAGLRGDLGWVEQTSQVRILLDPCTPSPSARFEAIPRRQCSRSEYDGSSLTGEELRRLEAATQGDGVSALLLTSTEDKERILEYVAAGNEAQFANPRWTDEVRSWVRFNAPDAVRTRDGLFVAVLGTPSLPAWIGKIAMRVAVSAARQSRKDAAHIRSSGAIAVISSEVDDARHWVEAGRSYQRMALEATALGLRTAFINQPVEVASLRPQLASSLGLGSRRPDLVVRIGRGPEMPRSLRRSVEEVIVGGA